MRTQSTSRTQSIFPTPFLLSMAGVGLFIPVPVAAQTPPASDSASSTPLAAIEKAIDAKREELHIPGVSLVIVKDDKILYIKGLGLKDVEHKLPVTPDTLFAIGSSTKAFTAMTVMMSVEEGKLKLTDSPKKYLPYFKLRDPEADSKITLSDLLCHRSGLPRTDLAMMTGRLSSEELIRLLGDVKPTAKFGERFQYQNLMFLTAGQIVAEVQGRPWTAVVARRIFNPLGMKATNTSIPATLKAPDHALGYAYDEDKKAYKHLPMRSIAAVAPAGAINSNARDMAQWLRVMLGHGSIGGKRLISQESYDLLTTKHMTVGGGIDYGYGWMLRDWHGHKVVEHGGNIDGFNAEVALMPDQNLGFVLLTNVTASSLGESAMATIWQNLVGGMPQSTGETAAVQPAAATVGPAQEAGTYHLDAANLDIKMEFVDGKLKATVPGQPVYTLANVGGRRYKIADPPIEGYFVTFRPRKDDPKQTEAELEQPNGKVVLVKLQPANAGNKAGAADYNGPMKELLGSYKHTASPFTLEVTVKNDRVGILVAGQPFYPLIETGKDKYKLDNAPDGFNAIVRRDAAGKVNGMHLQQPQGDLDLDLLGAKSDFVAPITVEELMRRRIEALGGEAALRRHHSRIVEGDMTMEHEGVTAKIRTYEQAPYSATTDITLYAVGKRILTEHEYFDGAHGGTVTSISPASTLSAKDIEETRPIAAYNAELDWKTLYKSVKITRMDKVNGEDVYVVEQTPAAGSPVTDYISTKSYLSLKRDTLKSVPGLGTKLSDIETYADYRMVDGVKVAFQIHVTSPVQGEIVITVRKVRFDPPIRAGVFER